MQNETNLCILAWNCSLGNYSEKEAKKSVKAKLVEFFHCDDEGVAEFVRQTLDFKYQNYPDFGLLVLESKVTVEDGIPSLEIIFDEEE